MKTKKNSSIATPFSASSTPTPFSGPTHDQIAPRARQLWENAGRPEGRDLEYWLEAERQLRAASGLRDEARRLTADPLDPASSDAAEVDEELNRMGGARSQRSSTSL
jgi:hypothetical protein